MNQTLTTANLLAADEAALDYIATRIARKSTFSPETLMFFGFRARLTPHCASVKCLANQ